MNSFNKNKHIILHLFNILLYKPHDFYKLHTKKMALQIVLLFCQYILNH